MTNRLLDMIKARYSLTRLDAGEFATLKANGMRFSVEAYHAEGFGHVSVMTAKGFFGLMKMDTLMIVPLESDLPLYSYDRIYAMGNDTLIVELYDTLTRPLDLTSLEEVKEKFAHLPERDPGEHWYDHIKLHQSISKKGKKTQEKDLDALTVAHLRRISTPLLPLFPQRSKSGNCPPVTSTDCSSRAALPLTCSKNPSGKKRQDGFLKPSYLESASDSGELLLHKKREIPSGISRFSTVWRGGF